MLYDSGIVHIKDIPRQVKLNDNQWMQIDCTLNKRSIVNTEAIEKFLSDIEFPLFFMDFETVQYPIVPEFIIGGKPYQQIPFQFSVHRLDSFSLKEKHVEFLAKSNGSIDPRISFIENLLEAVKSYGSIFAYNAKFEIMILKQLSKDFPKYKKKIEAVIDRIKDLMVPFENRHLYHFAQAGSVSLKKIVPVWLQGLISYDKLAISSGSIASEQYKKLSDPKISKEEKKKIREALLKYCETDTLSLVGIMFLFKSIIDNNIQGNVSLDKVDIPGKPSKERRRS